MQSADRKLFMATAIVIAFSMLVGCANLSHGIARDGMSAQQLIWPKPDDVNALHRGGTFPDLSDLRKVQSGLNKQQVMALIGPPQFGEGFNVREWDYLFNFRDKTGAITQCEYKILFDQHKIARSVYWHPGACADVLIPFPVR